MLTSIQTIILFSSLLSLKVILAMVIDFFIDYEINKFVNSKFPIGEDSKINHQHIELKLKLLDGNTFLLEKNWLIFLAEN